MLLIAKPKGSAPDVDYDETLVGKVRGAEIAARQDFVQKAMGPSGGLSSDLRVA